ncbi:hypothetical protein SCHPADRAFT_419205 [Schizopora paradoxa]|uniref:Uncharacterized protein n=1 Tax=Schizopora paradoxa TaxID=27342 RepID=A0A0H2RKN6_9AGAM|nr:hypothetical protein SCHPADRAFT_419205 [Schizopora paradoxa]
METTMLNASWNSTAVLSFDVHNTISSCIRPELLSHRFSKLSWSDSALPSRPQRRRWLGDDFDDDGDKFLTCEESFAVAKMVSSNYECGRRVWGCRWMKRSLLVVVNGKRMVGSLGASCRVRRGRSSSFYLNRLEGFATYTSTKLLVIRELVQSHFKER